MLNDRIEIPKNVVFEKIGEETVLLQLETSIYYGLNAVGKRMWDVLVESGSPETVLERIQEEYDISSDVASRDLERLLNELLEKKLISIEREAPRGTR